MDASVDVGLGTAYERLAVYRLLDRWFARRPIATAFEGPLDNMAGIPGIHLVGLARLDTLVTVGLGEQRWLDTVRSVYRTLGVEKHLETRLVQPFDELPSRFYDLALTYNALPIVDDWRRLLEHVASTSKRWLVVALTNPSSYGVWVRKALRIVEVRPSRELFDHTSTRPAVIEAELMRLGAIVEHAYFDCPWWPDLFVDAGESLLGATLKRLPVAGALLKSSGGATRIAPNRYVYGPTDFPLLDGGPELSRALAKHPVFDGRSQPIARAFGHLHAYLVELRH
jgi:hypothetical protein